jgi:hypothetical protein
LFVAQFQTLQNRFEILRPKLNAHVTTNKTGSNGSNLITLQELHHVVPKAAQAEFAKWKIADSNGRMDQAIGHL